MCTNYFRINFYKRIENGKATTFDWFVCVFVFLLNDRVDRKCENKRKINEIVAVFLKHSFIRYLFIFFEFIFGSLVGWWFLLEFSLAESSGSSIV